MTPLLPAFLAFALFINAVAVAAAVRTPHRQRPGRADSALARRERHELRHPLGHDVGGLFDADLGEGEQDGSGVAKTELGSRAGRDDLLRARATTMKTDERFSNGAFHARALIGRGAQQFAAQRQIDSAVLHALHVEAPGAAALRDGAST